MNDLFEEQRNEPEDVSAETPPGVDPMTSKPYPIATLRADALERVAETLLSGTAGERSGGDRYLINIHTIPPAIRRAVKRRDHGTTDWTSPRKHCRRCGTESKWITTWRNWRCRAWNESVPGLCCKGFAGSLGRLPDRCIRIVGADDKLRVQIEFALQVLTIGRMRPCFLADSNFQPNKF
jgi:hypothetical protein